MSISHNRRFTRSKGQAGTVPERRRSTERLLARAGARGRNRHARSRDGNGGEPLGRLVRAHQDAQAAIERLARIYDPYVLSVLAEFEPVLPVLSDEAARRWREAFERQLNETAPGANRYTVPPTDAASLVVIRHRHGLEQVYHLSLDQLENAEFRPCTNSRRIWRAGGPIRSGSAVGSAPKRSCGFAMRSNGC